MRINIRQHQITTKTLHSSGRHTSATNERLNPTLNTTNLDRYSVNKMLSKKMLAAQVCGHHTPPSRFSSSKNSRNPPVATITVSAISTC